MQYISHMVIYPKRFHAHLYAMAKKNSKKTYNCIREVLEQKGRSQTWLAEQLDLDFVTISRYVNNHRQPSIPTLFEIAEVLKVNPRDLLNS